MNNKKILLVDIDESLYPFAHTLHEWFIKTQGREVPWEELSKEYDLDKYIHDHVELQPSFVAGHDLVDPQPIASAFEAMELLHPHYIIRACTARNKIDWETVTTDWITKYFPNIDDIIYTRHHRGDEAIHKKHLAEKHKAHALIDDTHYWVQNLPEYTQGFVVERPAPLAADPNAESWEAISQKLWMQATRYQ